MFVKPYFFDSFKCKASECTDSCCIGWEIDIDSDSIAKYNAVDGEFGERLKANILTDGECSYFKLAKDERCPFLNSDNLCDIYINIGEESLCDICREHPRFYNEFAGRCEAGIGLCCERVCEILFCDDSPVGFVTEDDGYDDDFDEFEASVINLRQQIIDTVSDRSVPFFDRLKKLCKVCSVDDVVRILANTEPINDEWSKYISNLQNIVVRLSQVTPCFNDSDYEKLFVYILFRHFTKAVYDGETDKWLLFCVANIMFIYAMDLYTVYSKGEYTPSDRINNVKFWSKQIEYSEENIEYVKDAISELP